jgi:DNA-binding phage protein
MTGKMKRKFRDKEWVARYLTQALEKGDPINLQCALLDVITAQGGYRQVATKCGLSEWQLKLMLWDEGEFYRIIRLARLFEGVGVNIDLSTKRHKA